MFCLSHHIEVRLALFNFCSLVGLCFPIYLYLWFLLFLFCCLSVAFHFLSANLPCLLLLLKASLLFTPVVGFGCSIWFVSGVVVLLLLVDRASLPFGLPFKNSLCNLPLTVLITWFCLLVDRASLSVFACCRDNFCSLGLLLSLLSVCSFLGDQLIFGLVLLPCLSGLFRLPVDCFLGFSFQVLSSGCIFSSWVLLSREL